MIANQKRPARMWQDESGATGILFGLLILPLVGLMALAIDYSRFVKIQDRIQSSLDGAVLAQDEAALRGAFEALEAEPHEEGPHEGPEPGGME